MEQCFVLTGRIPSKKNSRINTRSGRSFPSKDYSSWHDGAMLQLRLQLPAKHPLGPGPFRVQVDISFPTLGRADLTNKAESVMDLLVDAGIIPDDSWTCVPTLLLTGRKDAQSPGAVVYIRRLE
jgi:hypothetical protein